MAEALTSAGALDRLRTAQAVALICHASPDSDCIGGMMAVTHALRGLGRRAIAFSPDPVPDYLWHVPGADEVASGAVEIPPVDLVVTIEAASLERLEPTWTAARARLTTTPILNIDHHASNTGYGDERVFDPRAASVCEVLYPLLRAIDAPIDPTVAYCLLTGVVGDTRSFRTSSTTPETLRVAGELIAAGAPLNQVSDAVHKHRTAKELGIWADVLGRARCEGGVLWTTVTPEDVATRGLSMEHVDGIVEFLSDTRDIAASVVFKIMSPERIRVSMRSDGRVDLTAVARQWGGGGHPQASGCTVLGRSPAEAEAEVVGAIQAALRASESPPASG